MAKASRQAASKDVHSPKKTPTTQKPPAKKIRVKKSPVPKTGAQLALQGKTTNVVQSSRKLLRRNSDEQAHRAVRMKLFMFDQTQVQNNVDERGLNAEIGRAHV